MHPLLTTRKNKLKTSIISFKTLLTRYPKKISWWGLQGDWNAKVANDAHENWKNIMGTSCNAKSNERGLRLLEFATYSSLVLANTLGIHKPSRRWTWHSPGDKYHNQIDYILVQQRFRSSVKTAKTRSFPCRRINR